MRLYPRFPIDHVIDLPPTLSDHYLTSFSNSSFSHLSPLNVVSHSVTIYSIVASMIP